MARSLACSMRCSAKNTAVLCWRHASTPSTRKPKPVATATSPTEMMAQATRISARVNPASRGRDVKRLNACIVITSMCPARDSSKTGASRRASWRPGNQAANERNTWVPACPLGVLFLRTHRGSTTCDRRPTGTVSRGTSLAEPSDWVEPDDLELGAPIEGVLGSVVPDPGGPRRHVPGVGRVHVEDLHGRATLDLVDDPLT